jgi:hypothetical protein
MPATLFAVASLALVSVGSVNPAMLAPVSPVVSAATDIAPRCTPEILELGELSVETPKTVQLTVTNNGTSAITVESMKAGCGCTKISDAPKTPIAPGASFTVDVTVDPGKKGGVDLSKTMTVVFVGGQTETVAIKGRVKAAAAE